MSLSTLLELRTFADSIPPAFRHHFYRVQLIPQNFGLRAVDQPYLSHLLRLSTLNLGDGYTTLPHCDANLTEYPVGASLIFLMSNALHTTSAFCGAADNLRMWARLTADLVNVDPGSTLIYEQTLAIRQTAKALAEKGAHWSLQALDELSRTAGERLADKICDVRLLMLGNQRLGELRRHGGSHWSFLGRWGGIDPQFLPSEPLTASKSISFDLTIDNALDDPGEQSEKVERIFRGVITGRESLQQADRHSIMRSVRGTPSHAIAWPVASISALTRLRCLKNENARFHLAWMMWSPLATRRWHDLRYTRRKPRTTQMPWIDQNHGILGYRCESNVHVLSESILRPIPEPLREAMRLGTFAPDLPYRWKRAGRIISDTTGFNLSHWRQFVRNEAFKAGFPAEIYDLFRGRMTAASIVSLTYPDLDVMAWEKCWREFLCELFGEHLELCEFWDRAGTLPKLADWLPARTPAPTLIEETRSFLRGSLLFARKKWKSLHPEVIEAALSWASWELYWETSARPVRITHTRHWTVLVTSAGPAVWLNDKDTSAHAGPRYNLISRELFEHIKSLNKALHTAMKSHGHLAQAWMKVLCMDQLEDEGIIFSIPRYIPTPSGPRNFDYKSLRDALPTQLRERWIRLPDNATRRHYSTRLYRKLDAEGAALGMGHAGTGVRAGHPLSSRSLMEALRHPMLERNSKLWPFRLARTD